MPQADRSRIQDPARLAALVETGLLDTPPEEVFDRVTRLAARLVDVPVSLVTLITDDRQFSKSRHEGAEGPHLPQTLPLGSAFCPHVVASGEVLVVPDSREHPLVCDNGSADRMRAYLGIPLTLRSGLTLGSLSA
jgi:GAF domain-containing protein